MQSWLHQVSMHFKRFHSLNEMELEGIDGYLRTHYAAIRLVTTMTDINACIIQFQTQPQGSSSLQLSLILLKQFIKMTK